MATKKIGDRLEWTSQAAGRWATKKGVVVAIVPGDAGNASGLVCDLFVIVAKVNGAEAPKSNIKGQRYSLHARYLVRVDRKGKTPLWYAPGVKMIDNGLAKAKASALERLKQAELPTKGHAGPKVLVILARLKASREPPSGSAASPVTPECTGGDNPYRYRPRYYSETCDDS